MSYSATIVKAAERTERTEIVVDASDESKINSPDYECESYREQITDVRFMRDVYGGTKTLRAKGEQYLPRHPMETEAKYRVRLGVAVCYNALAKTTSGLTGMIFRKDPEYSDIPEALAVHFENIDMRGQALPIYLRNVSEAGLLDGHTWLHIEAPRAGEVTTRTEEKLAGLRPYWIHVLKEQAINWRYELREGRPVLTLFVYREGVNEPAGSFGETTTRAVRVLREITPGIVRGEQWVFRKEKDAQGEEVKKWVREEEYDIEIDEIPVVAVYAKRTGIYESEPPLRDIAYEQAEHYRVRSDRQKSMTFSSVAVPYVFGREVTDNEGSPKVMWGADGMLLLNDPEAKAGMLESAGNGLAATKEELQEIQARMASLGLQMLVRRTSVTATEKLLDKTEADSDLAAFAISLQDAVNRAYQIHAKYRGVEATGEIVLNRDFHEQEIDPAVLRVVHEMVAAGDLTQETLWAILRAGELLGDWFDDDEERKLLAVRLAERMSAIEGMIGGGDEGAEDDVGEAA